MKPVEARAKRRTKILHPFSVSAADVIFTAETKDGSPVSGKIEERRKSLFGYKSAIHDLKAENRFRIGTFKQGFRLSVIPDQDVTITFYTSHVQVWDVLKYVAMAIAGMMALSLIMNTLGIGTQPPA